MAKVIPRPRGPRTDFVFLNPRPRSPSSRRSVEDVEAIPFEIRSRNCFLLCVLNSLLFRRETYVVRDSSLHGSGLSLRGPAADSSFNNQTLFFYFISRWCAWIEKK